MQPFDKTPEMKEELQEKHYLLHRSRLRERFSALGIRGLQDYEIMELFLTFVVPQRDVKREAKEIIERFGSIRGFFDASEEQLKEIRFFKDKALTLRRFIREVSELYHKQQAEEKPLSQSHEALVTHCIRKLGFLREEEFWVYLLDSAFSIIKEELISKGINDKAPFYPRKILETALLNKAYALLFVHNHPSGNPHPSQQDIKVTKSFEIPARILDLQIYDHIIVAGNQYYSFKEYSIL